MNRIEIYQKIKDIVHVYMNDEEIYILVDYIIDNFKPKDE